MALSNHIIELAALALKDKVLTFTERQTIVNAAMQEGVPAEEINAYLDRALTVRIQSLPKEELERCPGCGHGVPLISDICPYCGRKLERQTVPPPHHTQAVPPPYITGPEAAIINRENQQTAAQKHNLKTCPDCGAPFPLISNICSHCGHILHEQQDSELNIKNLVSNIQGSISDLKSAPMPTLQEVLSFRMPLIMGLLAIVTHILAETMEIEILTKASSLMFLIGICVLFYSKKEDSPVAKADNSFYDALHSHEMYTRTVDSLYGENEEARDLLKNYAAEIENIRKNRNSNRNKIAIGMIAIILACLLLPAGGDSAPTDKYQANRQKYADVYKTAETYKAILPYPGKAVNDSYSPYLKCESSGTTCVDVINELPSFANMHLLGEHQKYKLRISGIKIASTGQAISRTDTCKIAINLLDKNGKIIKTRATPLLLDQADYLTKCADNLYAVLEKGDGNYYADFVSRWFANSIYDIQSTIDQAEYFTITYYKE